MRWDEIFEITLAILFADFVLWILRWGLHTYASYRSERILKLNSRKMYSNTVWEQKQ